MGRSLSDASELESPESTSRSFLADRCFGFGLVRAPAAFFAKPAPVRAAGLFFGFGSAGLLRSAGFGLAINGSSSAET